MIGIDIEFKNRPNEDGTLSSFTIKDCLVSQTSTPTAVKPEVMVHIPKTSRETVDGAWFDYKGHSYHVVGTTVPLIKENTPSRWDRYCIAQRIY